MRKLTFLVAAVSVFAAIPFAGRLGPVGSALLLVALGVALALTASASLASYAIAFGAAGAFTFGVLAKVSPAVAGAALVGLAFAERTSRVKGNARVIHAGIALVGGALAGTMSAAFAAASPAVRGVSVVVAAVLAALPLLVDADDPVAYALDFAASSIKGASSDKLREGAELRRHADAELLDRATARHVSETWSSLLKLAEARVRMEQRKAGAASTHAAAVRAKVDERIAEHVAALGRAYTAADAAHAAELSLDDGALRKTEHAGESMEQVSKAIVEEI